MEAIWKEIPGYEGYYQASNTGLIRSVDRWVVRKNNHGEFNWNYKQKVLIPKPSTWGYYLVSLYTDERAQKYIHVLVAITFIGEIPEKYEVNHKDGNKLNNNDWNLEIVTKSQNNKHAYDTGLKKPFRGKRIKNR